MRRFAGWLLLIAIIIAVPAYAQGTSAHPNGLEIYVFRVGQADSMLIVGPGPARRTLLVDMGVSKEGRFRRGITAEIVARRIEAITGRRHVDYFLISHFHYDHFGDANYGMAALVDREHVTIGTVIDTDDLGSQYLKSNSTVRSDYRQRINVWRQRGAVRDRITPQFGTNQIDLGAGVSVDILAYGGLFGRGQPSVHATYSNSHADHYRDHPASENDLSIAFELSLGNFEFWSAGDLSGASDEGTADVSGSREEYTNVEFPMVRFWRSRGRETDVEVYRASHHGARYSSSVPLLEALDPEHIIYSADVGHRHPTRDVVTRVLGHVNQWATGLDRHWGTGRDFRDRRGRLVDEVRIFVSPDGSRYTINGTPFRSFSDAQERANADRN